MGAAYPVSKRGGRRAQDYKNLASAGERVRRLRRLGVAELRPHILSLNRAVRHDHDSGSEGSALGEFITAPTETVADMLVVRRVHAAVATLKRKHRELLTLRYGLGDDPPLSLDDVADRLAFARAYPLTRLQ